jgi:hypothetical protein
MKMVTNIVGYLHHAALLIGSNIVGFANHALVYDHIESISHITNIPVNIGDALDAKRGCYNSFHLQKAAKRCTRPVNGQVCAAARQENKLWNELFGVLVRTVYIVPACNDAWQLIRRVVCLQTHPGEFVINLHGAHLATRLYKHLRRCLCSRIRIRRLQCRCLATRLPGSVACLAIHLICAYMDETLDEAVQTCRLQQIVSAVHIVLRKRKTVPKAVVNVRLVDKSA